MRRRRGDAALERLGEVRVGGVVLPVPFMTASGTSGHDVELGFAMDLSRLGAVTVKSLWHDEWAGNPPPRVHTAAAGMLNAVGLQGPGVDAWIAQSLPRLEAAGARCVASIWGLPQSITRSCSGSSGGRPRSAASLPLSISSLMRPWCTKGSRVTVG